ncbi:hypothetical protein JN11_02874 [Mucilaginibacter frigoritolerans]|uniref:Uncharacterized protein n=1 Tax=Mucilaginibacter frigoritolerans TaxID=652788 RepID=A0A562U018_9SPHI|nr:hypothetical protein [Mucilaginibacter frigoritolerans]TWI98686.1 hypothetical protein JN11_02874 [Mucilaginibacter frigoritolerans]
MKKLFTYYLILSATMLATIKTAKAQDATADPGSYMNSISNAETLMNKSYMAYVSAAAHSSRKRKIEKLRGKAVDDIVTCQNTINYLPAYKGDNTLRQSSLNYVQLCYKIFNEDYAHIVNMEDIAERSYDEMQAYLLLQQATNDTLEVAITRINKAQDKFAAKYNVTITSEKSELGEKMEATGRQSKYRDKVYLLFYKCNWEDNQLTNAMNEKNVTKVEQVRNSLGKFANEGLKDLDTLQAFENDGSLANACRQALTFYKSEAETQVPQLTDFYLKEENFQKLKTAFEAKSQSERTQQDVDAYNKGVNDMNAGVNSFNQINADLNSGRSDVINTWNATEKAFIDAHTPYYK